MRNKFRTAIFMAMIGLVVCCLPMWAETEDKKPKGQGTDILEDPGRLFNIDIPKGFQATPLEVPGILKWKKNSAEIYMVVADNFIQSGKKVFDALFSTSQKSAEFEKVERVAIKGGKAFLCKEKAPSERQRPRSWRLVVVTDKKIINVDFTAPNKDFDSHTSDFEATLKSFKLRHPSS